MSTVSEVLVGIINLIVLQKRFGQQGTCRRLLVGQFLEPYLVMASQLYSSRGRTRAENTVSVGLYSLVLKVLRTQPVIIAADSTLPSLFSS